MRKPHMMRLLPIAAIALLLAVAAGCSENAGDDPDRVLQSGGIDWTERELRAEVLPDLTDEGIFCAALNGLSDDQAVAAFVQQLSLRPEQESVPADERRFVEIAHEECADILAAPSPTSRFAAAAAIELDPAPDLPGEYVNLPEIYQDERGLATYGSDGSVPNTAPHVTGDVDYAGVGNSNPPAGGPHWAGGCPRDPLEAGECGPAAWGIYRDPWPPATLVHNMEHGGMVVWYNTTGQAVIDDLEDFANSNRDKFLVLTPYPEMEDESVAITIWSRLGLIPASEYSRDFIDDFMDDWYCKFDPEGFC